MVDADTLLVEIVELISSAADQVVGHERTLGLLDRNPYGDSLGLYLLGFDAARLLPPGTLIGPREISPDPLEQLRAAEQLTRGRTDRHVPIRHGRNYPGTLQRDPRAHPMTDDNAASAAVVDLVGINQTRVQAMLMGTSQGSQAPSLLLAWHEVVGSAGRSVV